MEELFNSIIAGIALEGLIGDGSWLDAGANDGITSCFYAGLTNATIHAVDPSAANVRHIHRLRFDRSLSNLQPFHGGLGNIEEHNVESRGQDKVGAYNSELLLRRAQRRTSARTNPPRPRTGDTQRALADTAQSANRFSIFRLDSLFETSWRGETLAFAHLDVDGLELSALEGATRVILRDRPILTVELEVWKDPAYTHRLLEMLITTLRYEPWLVEEVAGYRHDTRNLIAFPAGFLREKRPTSGRDSYRPRTRENERRLRESSTLALAVGTRRLLAVTHETIQHLAFPCCVAGGDCCPRGRGACCSPKLVHAWLAHAHEMGGRDLQYFTRSQWFSNGLYSKHPLEHAAFAKHQLSQMQRRANLSGFDAFIDDGMPGSWAKCFNGSCYPDPLVRAEKRREGRRRSDRGG